MENSCNNIIYLHIYGLIIDPHNDLLPVGLKAQLSEHRTGITEVIIRIPVYVQAEFFEAFLAAAEAALQCDDQIHSHLLMPGKLFSQQTQTMSKKSPRDSISFNKKLFDKECRLKRHELRKLGNRKNTENLSI